MGLRSADNAGCPNTRKTSPPSKPTPAVAHAPPWYGQRPHTARASCIRRTALPLLSLMLPLLRSVRLQDPEKLFEKLDRVGKGSFGEVFKG
jgi:hypothetical protein